MGLEERFIKELHQYNSCFPNISGLDIHAGSVLSSKRGRFKVEGRLDQFITNDDALKSTVTSAIERLSKREPSPPEAGASTLQLSLQSSGTTCVSSDTGITVKVENVGDVVAQVVIGFAEKSDFLFDVVDPAAWLIFSDTESKSINQAALRHLDAGQYVVTSVARTKLWTYRISSGKSTKVAFRAKGSVDKFNVNKIAELMASTELTACVDNTGSLKGTFTNSVACFSCIKRVRSLPIPWPHDKGQVVVATVPTSAGNNVETGPLSSGIDAVVDTPLEDFFSPVGDDA